MMVMIPAAIMTVIVIVILLAPMMLGGPARQMQGWALLAIMTLSAMGIYLWRGSPDIPSMPALFQTSGPAFEQRAAVKKEMALMRQLAEKPDDAALMFELGVIQLQNGRLDTAIATLGAALTKDPGSEKIRLKLGAAHYAAALSEILLENSQSRALEHFEKALKIAPENAPYRDKMLRDMEQTKKGEPGSPSGG